MLKISNLTVNYGHISALRGISFEVPDNQIVSLIGANGAGKTTTLMAISGMVHKAEGQVIFMDQDITNLKPHMITGLGISQVPEGRHVFPKLSVEENLTAGTFGKKGLTKNQISTMRDEMYEIFPRLKERRTQFAGTLSGGEQQMVAIARGLMCDPQLVMLDEPSLGLAPIVIDEIFELIQKIKPLGKTVLLIEQNASLALSISDYAYVLELGEISLHGTGMQLLSNDDVKRAYLGI